MVVVRARQSHVPRLESDLGRTSMAYSSNNPFAIASMRTPGQLEPTP